MNRFLKSLSCLLVASVAVLGAGVAWSGAEAKTSKKTVVAQKSGSTEAGITKAPVAKKVAAGSSGKKAPTAAKAKKQVVAGESGKKAAKVSKLEATAPSNRASAGEPMFVKLGPAPAAAAVVAEPTAQAAPTIEQAPPAVTRQATAAPAAPAYSYPQALPSAADSSPQAIASAPQMSAAPANPYLAGNRYLAAAPQTGRIDTMRTLDTVLDSVQGLLPTLPMEGQAILPVIKTVYPTGEKPLKVLTFKCPTELIGISPPSVTMLHQAVNVGMSVVNSSNLLPFNMQQVCQ